MKYSQKELSLIAKNMLEALDNPQYITYPMASQGLKILQHFTKLSEEECLDKIKDIRDANI